MRHTVIAANLVRELGSDPAFIAEVLSASTEKYDRGAKSEHYRAMPGLSEYLLVSQDRIHVELYTRSSDGWLLHEWIDAGATVDLAWLAAHRV